MPDEHHPPRRILLADADAFFVAVARLVDPEGAGKAPLLIVGGAAGSRGVVCSASYETRRFGVRSAMPISRALRLCPDATCVPVPRRACGVKHREIRAVLERFTPSVQAASIDEEDSARARRRSGHGRKDTGGWSRVRFAGGIRHHLRRRSRHPTSSVDYAYAPG